jgi:GAF domain-containing protein
MPWRLSEDEAAPHLDCDISLRIGGYDSCPPLFLRSVVGRTNESGQIGSKIGELRLPAGPEIIMSTESAPYVHESRAILGSTKKYIDACFSVSGYSSVVEDEYEKSLVHLHQSYLHFFEQEGLRENNPDKQKLNHILEEVKLRAGTLRKCQRPLFQSIPKFYDLQLKEMLVHATKVIHENLDAQICSIFLVGKNGRLLRQTLHGTTHRKQVVDSKWFPDESYEINNLSFVGRTAVPSQSSLNQAAGYRFGEICHTNIVEQDFMELDNKEKYAEAFGPLYEVIAVPINNRNRTVGVLRIINKIDRRTQKVLRKDPFTERDFYYLSLFASEIGYALINLERDAYRRLFSSLLKDVTRPSSALQIGVQPAYIKEYLENVLTFLVNNEALPFNFAVIRSYSKAEDNYQTVALAASDRNLIDVRRDNKPIKANSNTFVDITCTSKEHIVISDISPKLKNFHNADWIQQHGFTTFCCFPLVCRSSEGDKAYGTLSLYTIYKFVYDTRIIELLQTVVDTVSTYLYVESMKTNDKISNADLDRTEKLLAAVCNFPSQANNLNIA